MKTTTSLLIILTLFLIAGCAGSKKAMEHPLAGMWDYSVDTPEGVYSGLITITELDGVLQGFISGDGLTGQVDLTEIQFMENKLTLNFDSGQFGVLNLSADIVGDSFSGTLNVPGVGQMPLSGNKKVAADM